MVKLKEIGPWAYIVGLVIAVIAGFLAPANPLVMLVLGMLGVVVGLLNVNDKELSLFLISSLVFVTAGSSLGTLIAGLNLPMGASVGIIGALNYLVVFVAPAAALLALLALYRLSKD